jgi:hypothetical protein
MLELYSLELMFLVDKIRGILALCSEQDKAEPLHQLLDKATNDSTDFWERNKTQHDIC